MYSTVGISPVEDPILSLSKTVTVLSITMFVLSMSTIAVSITFGQANGFSTSCHFAFGLLVPACGFLGASKRGKSTLWLFWASSCVYFLLTIAAGAWLSEVYPFMTDKCSMVSVNSFPTTSITTSAGAVTKPSPHDPADDMAALALQRDCAIYATYIPFMSILFISTSLLSAASCFWGKELADKVQEYETVRYHSVPPDMKVKNVEMTPVRKANPHGIPFTYAGPGLLIAPFNALAAV